MIKKFTGIVVAAIMLFCSFTLAACQTLDEYKEIKTSQLQEYADTKIETNDYYPDGLAAIAQAVLDGKNAIESAENKVAVNTAVDIAKLIIGDIKPKEAEMAEILSQFDLTDPKIIWNGNVSEDFTDDVILVMLRKTSTYPELQIEHFGLNNAESLEYAGGVRPPDYFFTKGNEELLENYRQIVFIHLHPLGKEKIIETIRALERLEFVKSVEPNSLGGGGV